jgi:hypothetical protein
VGQRLDLQTLLEETLGSANVYFQPPASVQMQYPCIVYQRYRMVSKFADNNVWHHTTCYQVTVIDPNPDGLARDKIADLPMCLYNRFFVADNLNHDVFNLYY